MVWISEQSFSMCRFSADAQGVEVKVWKVKPLFQNFLMWLRRNKTFSFCHTTGREAQRRRDLRLGTSFFIWFLHLLQLLLFLRTIERSPLRLHPTHVQNNPTQSRSRLISVYVFVWMFILISWVRIQPAL